MIALKILGAACAVSLLLPAQTDTAETATHEAPVTFQSRVNLVPLPVVVRDKKSNAVGNLTKDDFQIFDNGKLQVISRFSIEKSGAAGETKTISVERADGSAPPPAAAAPAIAGHFAAYVFDDLHFNTGDLMRSRQAALKHFDTLDNATSRTAVYTTSGVSPEDFTSDRKKLEAALNRLTTRSRAQTPNSDCPYLSYYAADQIVNKSDDAAFQAAIAQSMACPLPPPTVSAAQGVVRATASQVLSIGDNETHTTITALKAMVRRIAAMPGQRTLVLVSPGFIFPTQQEEVSELIDLAIRNNVVINSVDGRGLYVDSQFDASRPGATVPLLADYEREESRESGDTLSLLADGTGGTAFANNNDLAEAFRRTGSQPEFTYMLGFSPQNLKNDGKFHSIKVKLKDSTGLTLQARRGYFAPKRSVDAQEKAKQDIEDALFSREEMTDFPLSINTQFFKTSDTTAKLSIVARIGLKGFRFRKADGRNNDRVTIVTGLFDRDGNYLSGKETIVDLHFHDETLAKHASNGMSIRASFDDIKPGVYVLRLVARDTEGQMISAANGAIEVP